MVVVVVCGIDVCGDSGAVAIGIGNRARVWLVDGLGGSCWVVVGS